MKSRTDIGASDEALKGNIISTANEEGTLSNFVDDEIGARLQHGAIRSCSSDSFERDLLLREARSNADLLNRAAN
jgi:hypothetical protein